MTIYERGEKTTLRVSEGATTRGYNHAWEGGSYRMANKACSCPYILAPCIRTVPERAPEPYLRLQGS